MIDFGEWEERAAIMEFDGGLSRFRAETEAARRQGHERWEVMDALGKRDIGAPRDQHSARDGDQPDDLSGVQSGAAQEDRPMPVGERADRRRGVALPPLRVPGR